MVGLLSSIIHVKDTELIKFRDRTNLRISGFEVLISGSRNFFFDTEYISLK